MRQAPKARDDVLDIEVARRSWHQSTYGRAGLSAAPQYRQ